MGNEITLHDGKKITAESLGLKPKKSLSDMLKGITIQEKADKVLILIVDGSGSMGDTMGTNSKISVAWGILNHKLLPNMSGWNLGIILFHGYQNIDWVLTPRQNVTSLVGMQPYADGSTPMRQALHEAWDWVSLHAKGARFVMLSDGEPDDSKDVILTDAREHTNIPIDTIGIGSNSGFSYDPTFLLNLSQITGGIFVEAGTVTKLTEVILKLSPTNRPLLGMVTNK